MNSKERAIAALKLEEPDLLPVAEVDISAPIVRAITGKPATTESVISCYMKLGMDMMGMGEATSPFFQERVNKETAEIIDEWGIKWQKKNGMLQYVGGTLQTPEEVDNFEMPDPYLPGNMSAIETTVEKVGEKMAVVGFLPGLKMAYLSRGFAGFVKDMFRNPSVVNRYLDRITEYNVEVGKQMTDCGVDILLIGGDLATNEGPLFSPNLLRKFFIPRERKMAQVLRRRVPIIKHSDGNLYEILDDLVNMGIAALHPLDPTAGMDIGKVKKEYGDRLCLIGNIDCSYTLPFGTRSEVIHDVRECIRETSHSGGHILSSSNSFHPSVKVENIFTMIKTARKYGKYPFVT